MSGPERSAASGAPQEDELKGLCSFFDQPDGGDKPELLVKLTRVVPLAFLRRVEYLKETDDEHPLEVAHEHAGECASRPPAPPLAPPKPLAPPAPPPASTGPWELACLLYTSPSPRDRG